MLRELTTGRDDREDMSQQLDTVTTRMSRLIRAVERVQAATAEFREGCRVDQLARLKDGVRELRDEAKHLDKQW